MLLIACLSLAPWATAQDEGSMNFPVDEKTDYVTFEKVIQEKGVPKEKLYQRALTFFKTFYKNPNGVIEKKEENKGVWGHDRFFLWDEDGDRRSRAGLIEYDVNVQVKNGRYKYEVTKIFKRQSPQLYIKEWVDYEGKHKEKYQRYLQQIHEEIDQLITELKETMNESLEEEGDDDW